MRLTLSEDSPLLLLVLVLVLVLVLALTSHRTKAILAARAIL